MAAGITTCGTHLAEVMSGTRRLPAARTEALLDGIPPEPPAELPFSCPCGARLQAGPAHFDKRVQCGKCGPRLILAHVYDGGKREHRIEVLRLSDAPSGETQFLGL